MADNKKGGTKEYSTQELIEMFSRMSNAVTSGNMSDTVFGAPESSENYDVVASNSNAMKNMFVNKYTNDMIAAARFKRVRAVAAATGTGMTGVSLLDKMMQFSPGTANAILGHQGADEALKGLLTGASGYMSAIGMRSGGVMDPQQMAENMKWAASLGAFALNNNFDKQGRLDARFTRGLSLNQSAAISSSIMSDRSHYDEWEREQHRRTREWTQRNPNATYEQMAKEGILTEGQASAFRRGLALPPAAVKSFSDHVKKFQEGINGLVSSVSKITGGFESAVDFLQDMTNGKLFTVGKDADSARRRASVAAANLRSMAADAGVDAKTLHNMMYDPNTGFGAYFNSGNGRTDIYEQRFRERGSAANIAMLGAASVMQYKKDHPNATAQDIENFQLGVAARSAGLGGGDAVNHNVLLADAVKNGFISKDEAKRLAASGNQEHVHRVLKQYYGNIDMMMSDKIMMDQLRKGNETFVQELDTISYDKGTMNEGITRDQRGAFRNARQYAGSLMSRLFGKSMSKELGDAEKNALLSDSVLDAVGLSEEDKAKVREKTKNFSAAATRRYLAHNMGVDERELNRAAFTEFEGNVKELLAGKEDDKRAQGIMARMSEIRKDLIPEVTRDHLKSAAINKKVESVSDDIKKAKADYNEALLSKDDARISKAYDRLVKMQEDAFEGKGDMRASDENAMLGLFGDAIKGLGAFSTRSDEDKVKIAETFQKQYTRNIIESGLSAEQAMQQTIEFGKKQYGVDISAGVGAKRRRELAERSRIRSGVAALTDAVMDDAGIGQADKELARNQIMEKMRDGSIIREAQRDLNNNKDTRNLTGRQRELALQQLIAQRLMVGSHAIGVAKGYGKENKLKAERVEALVKGRRGKAVLDRNAAAGFDNMTADKGSIKGSIDMDKVQSDPELVKEATNIAAAEKSGGQYVGYSAQAMNQTNGATSEATKRLGNETNSRLTEAADILEAQSRQASFGGIAEFDEEEAATLLKFGEKEEAIASLLGVGKEEKGKDRPQTILQRINDTQGNDQLKQNYFKVGAGQQITSHHLKDYLANILKSYGHLSEEEFAKNEEVKKSLSRFGIKDMIFGRKDSKGNLIGGKKMMAAVAAGLEAQEKGGKTDEVKAAMQKGYIAEAIKNGDKSLQSDQAVNWLRLISERLEAIQNGQKP